MAQVGLPHDPAIPCLATGRELWLVGNFRWEMLCQVPYRRLTP